MKYFYLLIFFVFVAFSANCQLTANFTANTTQGCGSLSGVQFTDLSVGNATSWQWSFGNGNSSQTQNPSANYTSPGNYNVMLIVGDGTNFDTILRVAYINVFKNPTASFSFSPNTGCTPLTVTFNSNITLGDAPIQVYRWNFKDGSPSPNIPNPQHAFQQARNYVPNLEIEDLNGCKDNFERDTVKVLARPVASFNAVGATTSCLDSLLVDFRSSSSGNNLTYLWDFGDGFTSTLENPSHLYRGYGVYDVTLTVTDPFCTHTVTLFQYIRLEQLQASFILSDKALCLGEELIIENTSTSGANYSWSFGDGTNSTVVDPQKIYQTPGTFTINLTVNDGSCVVMASDTIYIEYVEAKFITDTTFSCQANQALQFTSTSVNAVQWEWNIENRLLGSEDKSVFSYVVENPSLSYGVVDDVFTDQLIVTSPLGCIDTLTKVDNRTLYQTLIHILNDNGDTLDHLIEGCFPFSFNYNSHLTTAPNLPPYTYSWSFGNGQTFNGPDPPFRFDYLIDTTNIVKLTVNNALGCFAGDSSIINPGRKITPVVSIFPDTVCPSDTLFVVDLTPDSSLVDKFNYVISGDTNGLTISDEDKPGGTFFTSYKDTGYHRMSIKYTYNGCDTTILINNAFYVKGPIVRASVTGDCSTRNSVSFKGEVRGADRFVWNFGDTSNLDSTNLNPIHNYDTLLNYTYCLTAFNDSNSCPPTKFTEPLNLERPPLVEIIPKNLNVCLNETLLITSANLNEYDTIEWRVDDSLVSVQNSFIMNTATKGFFNIELRTVDRLGCEYIFTEIVSVNDVEANFEFEFISKCFPNTVRYYNTSVTTAPIKNAFFILENNDTLASLDTSFLYNTPGFKDAFYYVEDIYGCKDSILIENHVQLAPFNVSFSTVNSTICIGDSILFKNNSSGLATNYTWIFGTGDSLTSLTDSIYYQFNTAGIFKVTLNGIDINGCEKSFSKDISVDSIPIAGFTADTTKSECYPLEVQFQDISKGPVTAWFWKIGSNDDSRLPNPIFNFTEIGKYDVSLRVITQNGCADEVTKLQYIETNGPSAEIIIDKKEGCINEPFVFTVTNLSGETSFVWDFGDGDTSLNVSATHAYSTVGKIYPSLVLTDSSGSCKVSILDSITIYNVIADFTVSQDTGCTPLVVDFANTSVGSNSLLWNFGQGTTSTNNSAQITYSVDTTYLVSLSIDSDRGCKDTAYKFIHVLNNPTALVSNDTGVCIGDSVLLVAAGGNSYSWSPNRFISSTTNDSVFVFPDTTTVYSVIVASKEGCSTTENIEVRVVQPPVNIPLKDSNLIIGENLILNGYAGPYYNYKWTPSTGLSCTNCPAPTAKPLANQTYYLTISDEYGCFIIKDTVTITITEAYSLDVPNAFSPNGDGINDIIYANGWGLKELIAFKIYNRFGELVFESKDFDKGWDGFYRGKAQNIETYIFTVEALTYDDKILSKKGNISLLR